MTEREKVKPAPKRQKMVELVQGNSIVLLKVTSWPRINSSFLIQRAHVVTTNRAEHLIGKRVRILKRQGKEEVMKASIVRSYLFSELS